MCMERERERKREIHTYRCTQYVTTHVANQIIGNKKQEKDADKLMALF